MKVCAKFVARCCSAAALAMRAVSRPRSGCCRAAMGCCARRVSDPFAAFVLHRCLHSLGW
eukprot:8505512-Pyramimonas_sp.AAC.1